METRTLILMRHAKTEQVPGKTDSDRELTDRGHRDAEAAGTLLAERFPDGIDLAYVSTAVRTRQTWAEVASAGLAAAQVREERAVYDATADQLLWLLSEQTPNDARSVMLVGHGPGIPDLLDLLAGSGPDAPALPDGFSTSGLAFLEVSAPWPDLEPHGARLLGYVVGRG